MKNLSISLTTEIRRLSDEEFEELNERMIFANLLKIRMDRYKFTKQEIAERMGLKDSREVTDYLRCVKRFTDKQINIVQNLKRKL